jgi:hypothetical protein
VQGLAMTEVQPARKASFTVLSLAFAIVVRMLVDPAKSLLG